MTPADAGPIGRILSVAGPDALVEVDAAAVCARCAAGKGCGAGLTGQPGRVRRVTARIPRGLAVRPGDRVRLDMAPRAVTELALWAYGLPLAGLVAGAVAGALLLDPVSDAVTAAAAAAGLLVAAIAGRRRLGNRSCVDRFRPTVAGRAP